MEEWNTFVVALQSIISRETCLKMLQKSPVGRIVTRTGCLRTSRLLLATDSVEWRPFSFSRHLREMSGLCTQKAARGKSLCSESRAGERGLRVIFSSASRRLRGGGGWVWGITRHSCAFLTHPQPPALSLLYPGADRQDELTENVLDGGKSGLWWGWLVFLFSRAGLGKCCQNFFAVIRRLFSSHGVLLASLKCCEDAQIQ